MPGESNPAAKITAKTALAIATDHAAGLSYGKLVKKYGVSKSQVARIAKGKSWAAVAERIRDDILIPIRETTHA